MADEEEVREVRIPLDEAQQRVYSAMCNLGLSTIPLAMSGGLLGGLTMSAGAAGCLGATLAASFVNFLYRLKQFAERSAVRNRLLDELDQNLGGNAEEFARRNPMAQVRQEPEGFISITNPDGSALVGIRERSAAARAERRMEVERAGAARQERVQSEEEELPIPTSRQRNPTHVTMRRLIYNPNGLRAPPINPAYLAAGAGYPRVGAIDDEEEKKEEEEGGFGALHRNNPFYRGIRGQPRR